MVKIQLLVTNISTLCLLYAVLQYDFQEYLVTRVRIASYDMEALTTVSESYKL